ncbi:MAG: YifB family Mg chelatase-like AAA ATPase [Thermacetogeniaceae bacterium]|jgi:magnesium chelatase family protein|nr:YifB family Mg chelatase-like AAA ATPase [Thermoanaerobacterales bacterium]NLN21280.1 YifB family Mg chelatase-like AAA ATPase [Syntrophomonadaceae bacterium]
MLSIINSCCCLGMETHDVRVEVDVSRGLPAFNIVGLPDAAVREAAERVRGAIRNAGFEFPIKRITVNLAPADLRKEGSLFDLPIAVGILAATGQLPYTKIPQHFFVGELSLDGTVCHVPGILSMAGSIAQDYPDRIFIVPHSNLEEAALIKGIKAKGAGHLKEIISYLKDEIELTAAAALPEFKLEAGSSTVNHYDFADVKGQHKAKRALEIAAAGGHNILMIGPPGTGKTLLARCLPSILPPLSWEECLEVTRIYSVAGLLLKDQPVINERPFRTPHHSASAVSIIGGGRVPRPGEVSFATHGVLFLDELPEFHRDVLEALRQPLEEGVVTVTRASGAFTFPARFILAASMNPCPCGYYGDNVKECSCTPYQVQRYRSRVSGPILDRIDLHVEVPRIELKDLKNDKQEESSKEIEKRVIKAWERQKKRFLNSGINNNAEMQNHQIKQYCPLDENVQELLYQAFHKLNLSVRAYDRIIKIARTIADLSGSETIEEMHIAEALQYRSLDRSLW